MRRLCWLSARSSAATAWRSCACTPAIAYADAVTIRTAGQKSKSGEHRDAATFLASVVAIRTRDDKAALKALQAVLNRKDEVSYADDLVGEFDAREMMARLDTFAAWADRRYAAMA